MKVWACMSDNGYESGSSIETLHATEAGAIAEKNRRDEKYKAYIARGKFDGDGYEPTVDFIQEIEVMP